MNGCRRWNGRRGWALLLGAVGWLLLATPLVAQAPPGPPFPEPVVDVVVYDHADILSPATETAATQIITDIEHRVGAEIVVYTQYKPGSSDESTDADALSLINQWRIGRAGFDDGLAIMWNVTRLPCDPARTGNGRVRLYAAPGYQAAYLSNAERQQIFDQEMLPHLRNCDEDRALLAALRAIDANATPQHAQMLALARFVDAAVGLILAPVAFLLLVGIAARSWLLYGKDPVYLDSPSIHMPAPPDRLTAASGAVIWEGSATPRALTTALLDLASRGEIAFREEKKLLREKAGIQLLDGEPTDPYVIRNRRRPLSGAEDMLLGKLSMLAGATRDGYIKPDELPGLASHATKFRDRLEKHVAERGWFREPPHKAVSRWRGRGALVLGLGILAVFGGFELPSNGLLILGVALVAAGVVIMVIAQAMPSRTMDGAMIYAMLAAYRRTLHKTMQMARSMNEVVAQAQLPWLETPDQALVWGVALGLHDDVEEVMKRSVEDAQRGVMEHQPWVPQWYGSTASRGFATAGPGGGQGGLVPGLFSSSSVPNFGGMMAALGSIGAAASSSSSSGGSGGFSGGGGGGGGGGAGGGY